MPSEVIESLIRSKKLNIFCIQYSIWFYTSKDIKLTLTWYFAMTTPTDAIPIKHMIVTLEKKMKQQSSSISEENQPNYQPRIFKTTLNKNNWQMRIPTPQSSRILIQKKLNPLLYFRDLVNRQKQLKRQKKATENGR